MEPLPDLGTLPDEDLKKLIERVVPRSMGVSFQPPSPLYGKIDILRAEARGTPPADGEGEAFSTTST